MQRTSHHGHQSEEEECLKEEGVGVGIKGFYYYEEEDLSVHFPICRNLQTTSFQL